jgi:hypothetical protein
MSTIKLTPNASGTGIFTIAAPNSNNNRTMTLADSNGTIYIAPGDGIQALASGVPAARTLTAGTGISITNGDGVSGNPTISSTVTGGVTSITAGTGLTGGTITTTGTIALDYYTGSANNNTSFPIGSYLATDFTTTAPVANNASSTLYLSGTATYARTGSSALAGTWRARGTGTATSCGIAIYSTMYQRTA